MEQQRNQERPAGGEADPNSCVGPASTTTTTAAPMARRSVTLAEETNLETVPGAGGGGSSSSSVPVRPTRRLLRVVVVDYPTGIALFHHSWSWKGDPNLPGVAKVIVALYKLSQSLGGRGGAASPHPIPPSHYQNIVYETNKQINKKWEPPMNQFNV